MAYAQGNLILDDHYNEFASGDPTYGVVNHGNANVNSVWGVGHSNYGYGQPNDLTEVVTGNTVTATQWSTMIARIQSSASHQGTSLSSLPAITGGDLIEAIGLPKKKLCTYCWDGCEGTCK